MESKERKWLGDVKARCFLISSITCYAVQERERERERENGEKKSTCYWAIPINDQTSSSKQGQFITFDEAKSWLHCRCAQSCVIIFQLSFENHPQNVAPPTPKLHYGTIFQPAMPFPKPGRNVFTLQSGWSGCHTGYRKGLPLGTSAKISDF